MINPPANTALALLTDEHRNVINLFVHAPRDVERIDPAAQVVVHDAYDAQIVAKAGHVALYTAPIGEQVPADLGHHELWVPNCAYCDIWLFAGNGCQYPSHEGDNPNGQICPDHPNTDRPRPHHAKYRAMNEQTAEILVADPASPQSTRRAARHQRIAQTGRRDVAEVYGAVPGANTESLMARRGEVLVHSPYGPAFPGTLDEPDRTTTKAEADDIPGLRYYPEVGVRFRRAVAEWLGIYLEAWFGGNQIRFEWRDETLAIYNDPWGDHPEDQPQIIRPDAQGRYLIHDVWFTLPSERVAVLDRQHPQALKTLSADEFPRPTDAMLTYLSDHPGARDDTRRTIANQIQDAISTDIGARHEPTDVKVTRIHESHNVRVDQHVRAVLPWRGDDVDFTGTVLAVYQQDEVADSDPTREWLVKVQPDNSNATRIVHLSYVCPFAPLMTWEELLQARDRQLCRYVERRGQRPDTGHHVTRSGTDTSAT